MSSLRVLHVTDYASPYAGAFIRQLRMLDDELIGRGGGSSALCLTSDAHAQPWARDLEQEGWSLHVIPDGATRSQRRVGRAIVDVIDDVRPDVVHVHFGTFDLSARTALRMYRRRSRSCGPRLVWHYRTALTSSVAARSPMRRWKDWLKYRVAGRDVDLFVGVTAALAREVAERGADPDRCRGIVAGCDTDVFRPDPAARARIRSELGLSDDDVLVLHMGWSWHRKGGDLLAAALQQLDGTLGARVVAVSIGAPQAEQSDLVRRVEFTPDVQEWHQASDIFISASRSEGFGNGLVEAMACERVAIASLAQGQVETFAGVAGVVACPIGDVDAIASAIARLVGDRASWSELGAVNRQHVLDHHSMRRWASDMADAYGEILPVRIGRRSGSTSTVRTEDVA